MRDAMRPPMTAPLRERALSLLAEGTSHRQTALLLDVHRSTIDRLSQSSGMPTDPLGRYWLPPGQTWCPTDTRCPGCGGLLLILPCILCRDRKAMGDRRQAAGKR
ncbi:MAG TPA: helix-turn-helix domain-containing protein [Pirellulales bacterium]|jgi:hypothetical protein|nr:helix-turn-helix domain-containing protein [Pirellulales bacterium]